MIKNEKNALLIILLFLFGIPILFNLVLKQTEVFPEEDLISIEGKISTFNCSKKRDFLDSITLESGEVFDNFVVNVLPNEMRECNKRPKNFFINKTALLKVDSQTRRIYEWSLNEQKIYRYENSIFVDSNIWQFIIYIILLPFAIRAVGVLLEK